MRLQRLLRPRGDPGEGIVARIIEAVVLSKLAPQRERLREDERPGILPPAGRDSSSRPPGPPVHGPPSVTEREWGSWPQRLVNVEGCQN
jgi:hypothetical protein